MSTTSWTANDDDRMRSLIARGWTHQQVADELGRTRAAVCKRASRQSVPSASIPMQVTGLGVGITSLTGVSDEQVCEVRRLVHSYATDADDEALLLDAIGVAS